MIDYDPHRWRTSLFNISGSMVREILARTLAFFLISIVVTVIHYRFHKIDISDLPKINAVVDVANANPAFASAHPSRQPEGA